jgi:hypothetical protein
MTQEFKVWLQTTPPSPSWTAYRRRRSGVISVAGDHAEFVPKKKGKAVRIEHIFRVSKGWKNSRYGKPLIPVVDTYIEILYGDPTAPGVAFVNDGRWFGLAACLPHRKLLKALESLAGPR